MGTETLVILKTAYKSDTSGKTQVIEWFSLIKSGEMPMDDQTRSGHPSEAQTNENAKKLHKIILENRRQTIEDEAEGFVVAWSSIQRILREDLGMRGVAAKY